MTDGRSPVEILLVEDNPGDVRLIGEAWKECSVRTHLSVVRNGEEAMSFLRREGGFASAPRPDLVLIDLNLPRKDGRELLTEIRQDPDLRRLPVIVLTTSKAEVDVLRCYDLQANCYIIKPVGLDRLCEVLKSIQNFWFNVATLPPS